MELYRVIYIRGGMVWKTTPWYSDRNEALKEIHRHDIDFMHGRLETITV